VIVSADLSRHVTLGSGDVMAVAAQRALPSILMATERVRTTTTTTAFLRLVDDLEHDFSAGSQSSVEGAVGDSAGTFLVGVCLGLG